MDIGCYLYLELLCSEVGLKYKSCFNVWLIQVHDFDNLFRFLTCHVVCEHTELDLICSLYVTYFQ